MYKYVNAFTNRSGDSLPGYFARLYDSTGTEVDIFADNNGTPISTVSGVANAALSDDNGMFRWYVANGIYDIKFYDANDTFVTSEAGVPMYDSGAVLVDLASETGGDMVGNQLPAGANLRTQTYADFINGSPLMPSQFSGTDEQRLGRAITEANASRSGGQGQTVILPRGEITVAAPFNLASRVNLSGVSKRGSRIKADSAFSGSYMVTVNDGTSSMFDNPLQHLTLDCNDVASLGGIDSEAWQEGGGLRDVLIQKFRGVGVYFHEMDGGAALCEIDQSEIFG